ncbi:hypothetical protein [Nocardioides sp. LHG3406-4]|uniref:hypothetical protein n=1 Tax=Nocardioides sp. LHG3406-4 TaxID=2804575 RepID=UPI003CE9A53B
MPDRAERPPRDRTADERDRIADERDGIADRRDVLAGRREQAADHREHGLDDLADDLRGHARRSSVPVAPDGEHQRQTFDRSEDHLERSYKAIDRNRAKLSRDEATEARGQGDVDRQAPGSEADTVVDGV